jgi:hypothetical protein
LLVIILLHCAILPGGGAAAIVLGEAGAWMKEAEEEMEQCWGFIGLALMFTK